MEHNKIKELFAPYLDDMLTEQEKQMCDEHLAICSDCQKEFNDIKTAVKLISTLPEEEAPYDIASKVKTEILSRQKPKGFLARFNLRYASIAAAFIVIIGLSFWGSQPDADYGMRQEMSLSNSSNMAMDDVNVRGAKNESAEIYAPQEQREAPMGIMAKQKAPEQQKIMNYDAPQQTKIIRNADIEIKVKKYQDFMTLLQGYLTKDSGYIENSSLNRDSVTKQYSASLVLRVPEKSFQSTLDYLKTLGEFQRMNINSNDVTTQYIDTDARIKALKTQITTLQDLLGKAKNVEEMLKIQQELTRVLSEHDSLVSQNKYLDRAVSYSTIVVMLHEEELPQDRIASVEEENIFLRAKAGFIRSVNSVIKIAQQIFVDFITILPQLFILLFIGLFLVVLIKIKNKK